MDEGNNVAKEIKLRTRRQLIAGAAMIVGGFGRSAKAFGASLQQGAAEAGDAGASAKRTSLHQEVAFGAKPERIYEAILDAKQFAAFTGATAEIDPKPGGSFKMFGGLIEGRNVELILNQRIVQAWRPTHWDAGVYSIVKFELKPQGGGTRLVLDHTGFPAGEFDSLSAGWKSHYWDPLKKYLG